MAGRPGWWCWPRPRSRAWTSSRRHCGDLFGFRWALRCSTPQASDTILGQGWASQGCSAAEVDAGQRGVGLLLHEGGVPVRCRSFYLDDEQLDQISRRAELLRQPAPVTPSAEAVRGGAA